MSSDEPPPGEPKRLKLRSTFGAPAEKPAGETPPVSPEVGPATPELGPAAKLPSPRLSLHRPSPVEEAALQGSSKDGGLPAEDEPQPQHQLESDPRTSEETADRLEASTPASRGKTSPVYYVLLVLALMGSLYVLFKDKWRKDPASPAPGPGLVISQGAPDPARSLRTDAGDNRPESAPEAETDHRVEIPGVAGRFFAQIQTTPLHLKDPEGILLNGIVFPVGSLLATNPEIRLTAIEVAPSGAVAVFTSREETFRLNLR